MKRLAVALAIGLAGVATPALAEPTVATYRGATGEVKQLVDFYVNAVADGYAWSNAANREAGVTPLFCAPENLAITDEQTIDILDRWLEIPGHQMDEDRYLALEILWALKYTFPCEGDPLALRVD